MTTTTGISFDRRYALVSYDSIVYHHDVTGQERDTHITVGRRQKGRPISDYALATVGCDVSIGDDCLRRLAQRIGLDDDFTACYAAAQEVVAELVEDDAELDGRLYPMVDLPGEPLGHRLSIHDQFNLDLVGFERDGTTRTAHWDAEVGWYERCYPTGELVLCTPDGADQDNLPFYDAYYEASDEGDTPCPTVEDALVLVFCAHRFLGSLYPGRVSRDVNVLVLRWLGAGRRPELLPRFSLDAGDPASLEPIRAIFAQIAPGEADP